MASYLDPQSMLQTQGNNLQIGPFQGANAGMLSQAGLLSLQQAMQQQALDTQNQQLDLNIKQRNEDTYGNLERQLKAVQAQSDINLAPTKEAAAKSKMTSEMSSDELKQWENRLTKQQQFYANALEDYQNGTSSGALNNKLAFPNFIKTVNARRKEVDPNISPDHLLPEDHPAAAKLQLEQDASRGFNSQANIQAALQHIRDMQKIQAQTAGQEKVAEVRGQAEIAAAQTHVQGQPASVMADINRQIATQGEESLQPGQASIALNAWIQQYQASKDPGYVATQIEMLQSSHKGMSREQARQQFYDDASNGFTARMRNLAAGKNVDGSPKTQGAPTNDGATRQKLQSDLKMMGADVNIDNKTGQMVDSKTGGPVDLSKYNPDKSPIDHETVSRIVAKLTKGTQFTVGGKTYVKQ